MNVSKEVILKVTEVLKNQDTVDRLNQATDMEEAYKIACEKMEGVSLEDFDEVLRELKENEGKIELSEEDLDAVAGGVAASESSVEVSGGFKYSSGK